MGYSFVLSPSLRALTIVLFTLQAVNAQPNVAAAISVDEYGNRVSTLATALLTGLQSTDQATRQEAAATFSQQLGVSSADVLLGYQQTGEDAATAASQVSDAIQTAIQDVQTDTGIDVNIDEIAAITSKAVSDAIASIGSQDLSAIANKVAGDVVNPVFQTFVPIISQSSTSTSTSTSGGGSATASASTSVSSTPASSSSVSSTTTVSSTPGSPSIEDLKSSLESITSSAISGTVSVTSLVNNWVVSFVQAVGQYIGQVLVSANIDVQKNADEITEVITQNLEDVFQAADFDTDLLQDSREQIQSKLVESFTAAAAAPTDLTAILNDASQGVLDVIVDALNSGSGGSVLISSSQSVGDGSSSSISTSTSVSSSSSTTITADTMGSVEDQKQIFADQFVTVMRQIQGAPSSTQNVQAFLTVILQGVLNATALVIQEDTATQAEIISEFFQAGLEGAQTQIGGSYSDLNVDEIVDEIQSKAAAALKDVDFSQPTIDISGLAQALGEELFTILGSEIGTLVTGFDISGVSFTASGSTTDSSTSTSTSTSTTSSSTATADSVISIDDIQIQLNEDMLDIIMQIIDTPSQENIQLLLNVIVTATLNATNTLINDDAESQARSIASLFGVALQEVADKSGAEFSDLNIEDIEKQIEEESLKVFSNFTLSAATNTLDLSPIAQKVSDIVFNIIGPKFSTVIPGFQFTISGVLNNTIVDELRQDLVDNFTLSFNALATDKPKAEDIETVIDVILHVILTVAQSSNTDDAGQRSTLVLNLLNQTLGEVLSDVGGDFEKVDVSNITDEIYTLSFNIFTEYEEDSSNIQKILDTAQSNITKIVTEEITEAVPSLQALAGSIETAPVTEEPSAATSASVSVSVDQNLLQQTPSPAPIPAPAPAPSPAPAPTPTQSTTITQDFTIQPEGISVVDFKVSVGELAESGLANVTNADNIQDAVNSFASQFGINLANVIVYLFQNGIGDVNDTSAEIASAIEDALRASISINVGFEDLDIDKIVTQIQSGTQGSLQDLENGDDATIVVEDIANQVVSIIFDAVFTVASQQGMGSQPIQASFVFNATASSIEDLRERLTLETNTAFSQINSQTPSSGNEAVISQLSINMANILGNVLLTVLEAGSDDVDAITAAGNITEIVDSVLTSVVSDYDLVDLDVASIVTNINVTLIEAITAAQQPDAEVNSILQKAASSIFTSIVTALGSALGLNISGTVTISTNSTTAATQSATASASPGLSPDQFTSQLRDLFEVTFELISEDGSTGSVQEAVGNLVSQLGQLIANVTVNIVSDVNTDVSEQAKIIAGSFESALTSAISDLSGDISNLDIQNITNNIENIAFTVFSNISEIVGGETVTINLTPLVQELVNTVVQIIITQLTETIPGFQFSITIGATPETATTVTSATSATATSTSTIQGAGSTTLVSGLTATPDPETSDVCTCYTEEEFDARVMQVVNQMLNNMSTTSLLP